MANRPKQIQWLVEWFPCYDEIKQKYEVPDYNGRVPFLLTGKALQLRLKDEYFDADHHMMAAGILAVYFDVVSGDPKDFPGVEAEALKHIVEHYLAGAEFESMHDLVLRFADKYQAEFGFELSARILRSGIYLVK